ncbi:MAG TPA: endonuclease MutS2 [Longimicrobiales bacterium]|nr:endonuclease MutS2 [Longimicrobiales bacterium]
MTRHAREVLEFPRVLTLLGGRAASPQGRARLEALAPLPVAEARHELDRVRAFMDLLADEPAFGVPPIPEAETALARLQVEGGVLEALELHRLGSLLQSGREVVEALDERSDPDPHVTALRERIWVAREIEADIHRAIDADGAVLDEASKELKRIRDRLRGAHQRIVRQLEKHMEGLSDRIRVPDASVSVREGRYVIPVRREGRREVGGIVHDESGTGATIFVEPPVAVELMNELRELQREEQREIQRILRELTRRIQPFRHDLASTFEALVDLDTLHARARMALGWRAHPPEIADDTRSGFQVVRGRHPLLLASAEEVVPFDLEMGPDERTLLISGPNTGGKSVFLKGLGLLVLLARCGVVPPVGKGTRLPGVSRVFADIGDEQSIAESLSTFSAHLATMREIVEEADTDALVLMDELGTGTDPAEGAALARAILELLTERGCLTFATSHLGALKTLDVEGSGIVNASMQFDAAEMAPTYHLEKGRPGRSYGLAIARRLGFPPEVLERAEAFMEDGSANLEEVLEALEAREREARERAAELEAAQSRTRALEEELEIREAALRERERSAEERARQQARDILLDAREEVETAIRTVRESPGEDTSEAAREARRRVEEAAERQRRKTPARRQRPSTPRPESLRPGARVRVGKTSTSGTLVELREEKVLVEVSGLRMEVPAADVVVLQDPEEAAAAAEARSKPRGWSGPVPSGSYEIDLRGLRVDEVELELGRSLDGAILSDLNEVRIIHGKGTGAVKNRVLELLDRDKRIESFRGGHPGEGGSGVTVAVFR